MSNPFRYFKTSPEIIRLAVMLYVRFPLSLRNVEDLLHERGIDISHETVRFVDTITDQAGAVVERMSFGAWGKRPEIDWVPIRDNHMEWRRLARNPEGDPKRRSSPVKLDGANLAQI